MMGLRAEPGVPPPETLRSRPIVMAAACAAAVVFGILLPVAPSLALAAVLLVPLALAAPLAALSMLVAVTVLVPFEVQDAFAVMGGRDQPGLLAIDAIMVVALAGMAWRAARRRVHIDAPLTVGLLLALIATAALIWGVANGAALSEAGHEARRVALGIGTFLLARPLLVTQSGRRRLVGVLIGVGLALGVWGLAQWFFSVGYTTSGDVGVRPSDDPTSPGLMQLQGGMYAFPVAVTLAWAALASGQVRRTRVRYVLGVIMLLNCMCVVLTFERTIWAVTAVACVLVAVTSGASARRLAIRWAPAAGMALLIIFLSAGSEVSSALERLVLLGQVSSDTSFTFRVVESQAVVGAIVQQPVTGSGFGATITWGARDTFSTVTTPFVHNGYLWLAWKIGIPAAALVVLLLGRAIVRRTPPAESGYWKALRVGSRASLLALMLVGLTFPIFNALGITSAIGLLAAICFSDAPPDAPLSKE